MMVVSDEADPLSGHVLIEFIPIGRLSLDYQAPFHRWGMEKVDFLMQYPLSDQQAGVPPPLVRGLSLRRNDLVEVRARWDPELEAVILFRVLRDVMMDWH